MTRKNMSCNKIPYFQPKAKVSTGTVILMLTNKTTNKSKKSSEEPKAKR